eukprot:UN17747
MRGLRTVMTKFQFPNYIFSVRLYARKAHGISFVREEIAYPRTIKNHLNYVC